MPTASKRWRPSPLLQLTAGFHAAAPLAWAIYPGQWPFIVAGLAANHAALTVGAMIPRSSLLGTNLAHLPRACADRGEVALTFDDGPDPDVTPRVLDLLDRTNTRATFFCIGKRAETHPQIVTDIARRGHLVENHSRVHSNLFAFYGPRQLRRELERTQGTLHRCTGRMPQFFRAPAGMRGPFLDFALSRCGLRLVSWTHRGFDTVFHDAARILARLTRNLSPGDVLLLHDGSSSQDPGGEPVVLQVLPELLDRLLRRGLKPVPFKQ